MEKSCRGFAHMWIVTSDLEVSNLANVTCAFELNMLLGIRSKSQIFSLNETNPEFGRNIC